MKFYTQDDIALRTDDQVFKASPTGKCIYFLLFSALGIASLLGAIDGGVHGHGVKLPSPIFYFLAVMFGLCGWYSFTVFRASLKPTNWLLRCNSGGVIIKYRSFLNWRFPLDDEQVVGFDYSEIAWAGTVKEKRITPSMSDRGGAQSQSLTFLDFCLVKSDTSALEANLQRERSLAPDGIVTTRDYPVNVSSGGVIELRWSGGISPSVAKAIQYLSQHVRIATAETRKVDLTHHRNLSPEEERGKIVALLKSGDHFGAMKLTREIYGYSLSKAKDFLDKLQAES